MKTASLFFVKYPTPGKVKTRLAQKIGPTKAAKHYRELASHNFQIGRRLSDHGMDLLVMMEPPEDESKIKKWLGGATDYIPQQGRDLGDRLHHGFQEAFRRGYDQVAAIGSDTLDLCEMIWYSAFESLKEHEVVFGPAQDGGYYLVGLSRANPWLFEDIPWSTEDVLKLSIRKTKERHLTFDLLSPLHDLDEASDLLQLKGVS